MKPDEQYYQDLVDRVHCELDALVASGKTMFATSSFQSQSLPLLKILGERRERIKVALTNTGFLFPETVAFAHSICQEYGLELVEVRSEIPKSQQKSDDGRFLYVSDPDYCCVMNKTSPLEPVLKQFDIWINGVRRDQSSSRASLKKYEIAKHDTLRYHPMLNWTGKDIYYFRKIFKLGDHPLEAKGYQSVGCQPCTFKSIMGANERNSRWMGMNKTECGLNTDLIVSSNG